MTLEATDLLYVALGAYALGTLTVLASLISRSRRLQHAALLTMIAGFVVAGPLVEGARRVVLGGEAGETVPPVVCCRWISEDDP